MVRTYIDASPHLGILILNHNGKEWLFPIYNSIRMNGYPNVRIYLVDNASDDDSIEVTLKKYPEVTILRMPHNLGYCMAYNLAMPYAFADGCDWVIWANNDVRIEPGCLDELARVARSDPRIGLLGPAFLGWDDDEPNYYMVGNHPYAIDAMKSKSSDPIDVEWAEGSFLMVSRRCVEAVGPLDPYLFFYWEETDFCRRARYQGWRVVLAPKALARHYARGSTNQQNKAIINMLQSKNYYVYKLTNPFQSFPRNFMNAFHLLLAYTKQYFLEEPSSVLFCLKVFVDVLREISLIYKKWGRDRRGGHPPMTNGEISLQDVGIISGKATLV